MTVVNKLKGTLHLGPAVSGGVDAEAQVADIGWPQTVSRDQPQTMLDGTVVHSPATYSWQLAGTMVLDLTDPAGVYYFVNANLGQDVAFEFIPVGPTGPTLSGTVTVDGFNTPALAAGAKVTSTFSWPAVTFTVTPPP